MTSELTPNTGHSDWRASSQPSYGCALSQSRLGPASSWVSAAIPDTVVRFRTSWSRSPESEPMSGVVGKKDKPPRVLGPATIVKPALFGAAGLFLVQGAMKVFLHA